MYVGAGCIMWVDESSRGYVGLTMLGIWRLEGVKGKNSTKLRHAGSFAPPLCRSEDCVFNHSSRHAHFVSLCLGRL